MKQGIHPEYKATTIVCACGNRIDTKSTEDKEIHVEICSVCHPFYTGKQRLVDTAGRVERFKRKYGDQSSKARGEAAEAAETAEAEAEAAEEKPTAKKSAPKKPRKQPAVVGASSEAPEAEATDAEATEAEATDADASGDEASENDE